ncbi:uncharacterized protein LOC109826411 [Asparagus officinalis]|uniref:uncharacterized protein LOC109826411 n=1 Tax=Asparagus officinalis TaxID=4686 RepID=UPI00098E1B4A|nr:uncharacterized protein LOC109826411 [Asparagus officinalis]
MASFESFIQGLFIVINIFSIFFLQFLPNRFISLYRRHRQQNSTTIQGRRHFIAGAQTLAQARSQSPPSQTLIKSSISSVDLAIALEPRDAAPHIFKALALNLEGHKIPALKSLDVALSSPQLKTLGPKEKADALIKRAEAELSLGRRRRVDQAIEDLTEAMEIGERSGKGLGLLGECYEWKGMI